MAGPVRVRDLGENLADLCFAYPQQAPGRRHGPQGYSHYEAYRDWLRDEFDFRCAYCLKRETWLRGKIAFQIDHCIPVAQDSSGVLEYGNLVYTCPRCNLMKAGAPIPNPTEFGYGSALHVDSEGVVHAKNDIGGVLICGLRLDHPELTSQRKLLLRIVRLAIEKENQPVILKLLGYPDDLPDLKKKRPPGQNKRPDGLADCAFERRRGGKLPLIY